MRKEEQDIEKEESLFTLQIPLKINRAGGAKSITKGKTKVTGWRTTKETATMAAGWLGEKQIILSCGFFLTTY